MRQPHRTAPLSRREWMRGVSATGFGLAAGTASLSYAAASDSQENGSILPLTSNTDTLIPAPGRSFMKFSFDFPEPCIAFEGLQAGFRVFTFENVYAMDSGKIEVANKGDSLEIRCSSFLWAGSILPMGPVKQYTAEKIDLPLSIVIYPGADSKFLLYEDDGISFQYRTGNWMGIEMAWNDSRDC